MVPVIRVPTNGMNATHTHTAASGNKSGEQKRNSGGSNGNGCGNDNSNGNNKSNNSNDEATRGSSHKGSQRHQRRNISNKRQQQ